MLRTFRLFWRLPGAGVHPPTTSSLSDMSASLRLPARAAASVSSSPVDSENDVLLELVNRKGLITLNRPKALNALSLPMVRTMLPVLRRWNDEQLVDLVVLRACEGRAFCAGGDVKAIAAGGKGSSSDFFREEYMVDYQLARMNAPLVSLINGVVMGGGCGISFHGRFSVVTERALFAMPEAAIGLFPDVGACYFLARLKHNLGVFFGLTGARLRGEDLVHAGLVSHFVPADQLEALEQAILKADNCSPDAISSLISSFQASAGSASKFSLEPHLGEIDECFGADTVEEIMQRLRKSSSEFCRQQLEILEKLAPMSLKVSLRAIHEAKTMSLKEVFQMDMRLGERFLKADDFYEGVHALLVRKTNDPKWKPATLEECSSEMVDKYFAKLPADQELRLDF